MFPPVHHKSLKPVITETKPVKTYLPVCNLSQELNQSFCEGKLINQIIKTTTKAILKRMSAKMTNMAVEELQNAIDQHIVSVTSLKITKTSVRNFVTTTGSPVSGSTSI